MWTRATMGWMEDHRAGGIVGGILERGGKRIARLVWEPIHSEPLGSNSGVPF